MASVQFPSTLCEKIFEESEEQRRKQKWRNFNGNLMAWKALMPYIRNRVVSTIKKGIMRGDIVQTFFFKSLKKIVNGPR